MASGGVLVDVLRHLRQLSDRGVLEALSRETSRLKITRSLLNILFNICFTRCIHLSPRQMRQFRAFDPVILELMSRERSSQSGRFLAPNVAAKRRLLLRHPGLIRLILQACPTPEQLALLLRLARWETEWAEAPEEI